MKLVVAAPGKNILALPGFWRICRRGREFVAPETAFMPTELIDLVAFLQSRYELREYEPTDYPMYY